MIIKSKSLMHSNQKGFTLVEVMVGMVIGLLVTLVIVQVMSVFEGQKRVTTGTADAQTNGAIAMYNINRELQLAGFGMIPTLSDDSALKCNSPISTPVSITNGVSDSVTVRYSNSYLGGVPFAIKDATEVSPAVIEVLERKDVIGCSNGDTVLITKFEDGETKCATRKLNGGSLSETEGSTDGVYIDPNGAAWLTLVEDDPDTTENEGKIPLVNPEAASVICLGGSWSQVNFQANGGNLRRDATDNGANDGIDSVAGIVNIQAQYGVSASAISNAITSWENPTGPWATTGSDPFRPAGKPSLANRNRIKAIRIAVVARNPKREQAEVTQACSSLTAAAPTGLCAWEGAAGSPAPAIDLSADADWKHYRYRVFETIIPLRTMIWNAKTFD